MPRTRSKKLLDIVARLEEQASRKDELFQQAREETQRVRNAKQKHSVKTQRQFRDTIEVKDAEIKRMQEALEKSERLRRDAPPPKCVQCDIREKELKQKQLDSLTEEANSVKSTINMIESKMADIQRLQATIDFDEANYRSSIIKAGRRH